MSPISGDGKIKKQEKKHEALKQKECDIRELKQKQLIEKLSSSHRLLFVPVIMSGSNNIKLKCKWKKQKRKHAGSMKRSMSSSSIMCLVCVRGITFVSRDTRNES